MIHPKGRGFAFSFPFSTLLAGAIVMDLGIDAAHRGWQSTGPEGTWDPGEQEATLAALCDI